jgi:hypothetical protein
VVYLAAVLLLAAHALGVVFATHLPQVFTVALAASIYGPLWPLQTLGAPVFTASPGWGWASPSLVGWVVLVLFWGCLWLGVAWLAARLLSRR